MSNLRKLTPKQARAVEITKEEITKSITSKGKHKVKTKGEILKEAGYSKQVQETPDLVYGSKAVESKLSDYIGKLEAKRDMALSSITEEKMKKAKPRESAYVFDIIGKHYQLATGGATENVNINLPEGVYKRLLEREKARIVSVQDGNGHELEKDE